MNQPRYRAVWALVVLLCFSATLLSASVPADAQQVATTTGTIGGQVLNNENGLGIPNASVSLVQGTTVLTTAQSGSDGSYTFPNQAPGAYSLVIRAQGYRTTRVDNVFVTPTGSSSVVRTALLRAETGAAGANLREIGSVSASSQGNTLAQSSTIQYNLSPTQLQYLGYLKAADALAQIPGVNLNGSPHSLGDDTFIDIRGMGNGETRPLVDGHPVGPIGVGGSDTYDYANSSYFLMSNIQTTLGSGATGLYGVDVIGGTIDFQTLNPTPTLQGVLYQAAGDQATLVTELRVSDTLFGKLGIVAGHTVTGTSADFAPGLIFQGARPNNNLNLPNTGACTGGNDLTSCNQATNTYSVSGNYRLQNDLGKLVYHFSNNTSLALTAYAANQLSDSTGNGDNDNIPYDTRLAEIQANSTPDCGPGSTPTGYTVVTNNNPAACYTAQQYAAASSGPYGGGANRFRGTSLQDYNARFTTTFGINTFTADFYRDYYDFFKNSNQAAGFDATRTVYVGGGTYQDSYLTNAFLLTDSLAWSNNNLGFGYFVEHQRQYGNQLQVGPPNVFVPQQEYGEGDYSYFVRDEYLPTSWLSAYFNGWLRYSNVTNQTSFDPRLSLIFKPTTRDVIRLTGGKATGDPAASIKANGGIAAVGNPSSLNPSCSLLNTVASGGNPNLVAEAATDVEAAYGHRFWADTTVNLVGYVSSEQNRLFSGVEPILQFGPAAYQNPVIAGQLPAYAKKIGTFCGVPLDSTTVLPYLGVSTTYNAAQALYRGWALTGRVRANRNLYLDYDYAIQSSQLFGINNNILQQNPIIINGGQIYAIPVHTGNLVLDYNTLHGTEFQIQGYYVGDNNTLNRPAFTSANAFISQKVNYGVLSLSCSNLFNQNAQLYGYFGHQLFVPVNGLQANAKTSIQEAALYGNATSFEELGLSPRVVQLSLTIPF